MLLKKFQRRKKNDYQIFHQKEKTNSFHTEEIHNLKYLYRGNLDLTHHNLEHYYLDPLVSPVHLLNLQEYIYRTFYKLCCSSLNIHIKVSFLLHKTQPLTSHEGNKYLHVLLQNFYLRSPLQMIDFFRLQELFHLFFNARRKRTTSKVLTSKNKFMMRHLMLKPLQRLS